MKSSVTALFELAGWGVPSGEKRLMSGWNEDMTARRTAGLGLFIGVKDLPFRTGLNRRRSPEPRRGQPLGRLRAQCRTLGCMAKSLVLLFRIYIELCRTSSCAFRYSPSSQSSRGRSWTTTTAPLFATRSAKHWPSKVNVRRQTRQPMTN